jgi:DNA-binding MurR/RpiR family transcriptional regulator
LTLLAEEADIVLPVPTPEQLQWAAIGLAAVLLIAAVATFLALRRRRGRR